MGIGGNPRLYEELDTHCLRLELCLSLALVQGMILGKRCHPIVFFLSLEVFLNFMIKSIFLRL